MKWNKNNDILNINNHYYITYLKIILGSIIIIGIRFIFKFIAKKIRIYIYIRILHKYSQKYRNKNSNIKIYKYIFFKDI